MGKKEETVIRVVLDTNVLISAILFRGEVGRIADLWKGGRIVPFVSRETFEEFRRVLHYAKFRLTQGEIRSIIEDETLPFFEIAEKVGPLSGVCPDPDDDKFIACAVAAGVDFVVSGDQHLCNQGKFRRIRIIRPADLVKMMD